MNPDISAQIDTTVPHPARRYNYWLGGKDNFEADRKSGDEIQGLFPSVRVAAEANRRFLGRVVRYLACERGVDQFLDIGTGLPSMANTHEVAQAVNPSARTVYVDNDPLVMVHARALLRGFDPGKVAYAEADLRDPKAILRSRELAVLDRSRPIALMIIATLHFIRDDDQPYRAVTTLLDALPAGSFFAASHGTSDLLPVDDPRRAALGGTDVVTRTQEQFAGFFDGLDLVDPGITMVSDWRPDPGDMQYPPAEIAIYGAVGQKAFSGVMPR